MQNKSWKRFKHYEQLRLSVDHKANERKAAIAFSKQAVHFDSLYQQNTIIQYKRDRVRSHLMRHIPEHALILELNAGTGDDAVWLAQHGYEVHATDIASGMQEMLAHKVQMSGVYNRVTTELRSFTDLDQLERRGPFDCIFSNFAGLNCTGELKKILLSFPPLLKTGGVVTLVLLPKFCLWEFSLLFKGKFKTAVRRIFAKQGRKAIVEDEYFKCWYYNPSFVTNNLKQEFDLIALEGLCTLVPPSYMERFPENHPQLYSKLLDMENKWKTRWPWTNVGDYYIISLRKK